MPDNETTLILVGTPYQITRLYPKNSDMPTAYLLMNKNTAKVQDVSSDPVYCALFDALITAKDQAFEANRQLHRMEGLYKNAYDEKTRLISQVSPMKLVLKELGKAIRLAEEELGCD